MEIQQVVPATILVIDGEVCGVVLTVDPARQSWKHRVDSIGAAAYIISRLTESNATDRPENEDRSTGGKPHFQNWLKAAGMFPYLTCIETTSEALICKIRDLDPVDKL